MKMQLKSGELLCDSIFPIQQYKSCRTQIEVFSFSQTSKG